MKKTKNRPLVTVIVPSYNAEKFIKACLKSIQQQTYTNLECIVVDDGSEDMTYSIAQSFAVEDNRFKVFKQDHLGVSTARNYGVKLASGDFITFIDSDDKYDSHFLETAVEKIDNADLFIGGITNIEENDLGEETELESWTIPSLCFNNRESLAVYYIRNHKLLLYSNSNKLYRAEIIRLNSILFDEKLDFGEDRIFNYTYLLYANKVVTTDECFYYYYHRNRDSLSTKLRKFHIMELMYLHQKKMEWLTSVLNSSYAEELECFNHYDVSKEYNNACEMLNRNRDVLSKSELLEEEKVLDIFKESCCGDK